MSLLTARRIMDNNTRGMEEVLENFQLAVDEYVADSNKDKLYVLINLYSEMSYGYLLLTAIILQPSSYKDNLTYMNSLIVEACHEQGVKYFDREQGYSIIDKTVRYTLDNGVQVDTSYIVKIVEEMEAVYKALED